MDKVRTVWSYGVTYGQRGSGLFSSQPTLEGALARAFRDASYYLSIGYTDVRVDGITESCVSCCGEGKTLNHRGKQVKCKACGGKGTFGHVPGFNCALDDSIRIGNTCCDPFGTLWSLSTRLAMTRMDGRINDV